MSESPEKLDDDLVPGMNTIKQLFTPSYIVKTSLIGGAESIKDATTPTIRTISNLYGTWVRYGVYKPAKKYESNRLRFWYKQ